MVEDRPLDPRALDQVVHPVQAAQERRLPAARGADQRGDLVLADVGRSRRGPPGSRRRRRTGRRRRRRPRERRRRATRAGRGHRHDGLCLMRVGAPALSPSHVSMSLTTSAHTGSSTRSPRSSRPGSIQQHDDRGRRSRSPQASRQSRPREDHASAGPCTAPGASPRTSGPVERNPVTAPTRSSGAVSPNARARARIDAGEDPRRRVRQDVAPDDLPPRRPDAVGGLPDALRHGPQRLHRDDDDERAAPGPRA